MVNTADSLNILLNGVLVGKLEKAAKQELQFTYAQSWLQHPASRPISLSLPLIDKTFYGDIVYNFFDNILPDDIEIRSRIQTKFHTRTKKPFDLLSKIGKDCVGAIQISPEMPAFTKAITSKDISINQIADILHGYKSNPLGMTDSFSDFRISLAGAQEKTALLRHKGSWKVPTGTTPTTHILKLPIGYIKHQNLDLSESCENEWLCSLIARAFGLKVANCEIANFNGFKVLVVERFDRKWANNNKWLIRLPQEDICQALGISPNLKYQADGGPGIREIMDLLLASDNSTQDREDFFRSQVLFWLLAAIDGHAKNFSIFILPDGKYRLTPLYDIISVYPLIASKQLQKQKVKMAIALRGKHNYYKLEAAQRRYFIQTAKFAKFSPQTAEAILDDMLTKVEPAIQQVQSQLPDSFPKHISEPIFAGIRAMRNTLAD